MNEHTVTVNTLDHGPVTVPCPMWCVGEHPDGGHRVDIAHYGVDHHIKVNTIHGPRDVLTAVLAQYPFTDRPTAAPGNALHVSVQLLDGDSYPFDVAGLHQLAAELVDAATRVQRIARRLAVETRMGNGR